MGSNFMLDNGVSSRKKQEEAKQHQYPEDMWNSICRPLPFLIYYYSHIL